MPTAIKYRTRTRVRTAELQAILARRNISQGQFAVMIGKNRSSTNKLINGVHDPNAETRQRMMMALALGFDDLFEIVREKAS
jgi:transcriptional regulator with XRE-family HTH domain